MSTNVKSLDQKITVKMFVENLGDKFRGLLASSMTPEEKLRAIVRELEKDVQQKRVLARQIGAQKRALKDPDDDKIQPLEALELRRAKLVKLGGQNIGNAEMLGQIQEEIQSLDLGLLASQTATYETLSESYELAMANYKTARDAWQNARDNGPAILNAIAAHQQALEMQVKARESTAIDASFMDDLTAELSLTRSEYAADEEIERDLDATQAGSLDAALAAMDAQVIDNDLMAEFRAAAGVTTESVAAAAAPGDNTGRFIVTVQTDEEVEEK